MLTAPVRFEKTNPRSNSFLMSNECNLIEAQKSDAKMDQYIECMKSEMIQAVLDNSVKNADSRLGSTVRTSIDALKKFYKMLHEWKLTEARKMEALRDGNTKDASSGSKMG